MNDAELGNIKEWLTGAGITWNRDLLEIRSCDSCSGPAIGVWATADIKEEDNLCIIPKDSILSVRTTSGADIIEAEELGGGLGLIFAIMYELSLGSKSPWHGYFRSLPNREYIPMFWTDDELAELGSELAQKAKDDRYFSCYCSVPVLPRIASH